MNCERRQRTAGTAPHQQPAPRTPAPRTQTRSALGLGLGAFALALVAALACGEAGLDGSEDTTSIETGALVQQALSKAQEKAALKAIDDICGDTWCSGDYDFGFRKLVCDQARATCTLRFQVFPREGVTSSQPSYWRSCKTAGFTGFASVVRTAPNGYQSLEPGYYDALTVCIGSVLDKLASQTMPAKPPQTP